MGEVGKWVAAAREQKHSMALDNGGFSQLVLLFQDMAYGYAYALTRDPWTARDVVQESFLRAWLRLEQLDDPDAFPGWFRRIVRSTAVDELRRAGSRTAAAPLSQTADRFEDAPSVHELPDARVLRKESAAEVREAIDRLPQTLRASVILHYLDGCSIDQVASFLQIDVDAAKKRLQRGRERVKKDLERKIRDAVREHRPGKDSTLLEAVNIYTNFNIAAQLGQIALLEAMLVDGIDVNEVDATGRTLLHWAIENGHLEAVELLLKSGADQNIRDREGRSPRHLAQVSKSGSAVMRLLNAHRPAHDRVQACSDGGTRRQPGPR